MRLSNRLGDIAQKAAFFRSALPASLLVGIKPPRGTRLSGCPVSRVLHVTNVRTHAHPQRLGLELRSKGPNFVPLDATALANGQARDA